MLEGDTVILPLTVDAPKFDVVTAVAFVELQVNVELLPLEILDGDAKSETVGVGVGGEETLIFADADALPPGPETVIL